MIITVIIGITVLSTCTYKCIDNGNHALEYAVRDYNNGDHTIMETVSPNGRIAVTCIQECNQQFLGYLDELDSTGHRKIPKQHTCSCKKDKFFQIIK